MRAEKQRRPNKAEAVALVDLLDVAAAVEEVPKLATTVANRGILRVSVLTRVWKATSGCPSTRSVRSTVVASTAGRWVTSRPTVPSLPGTRPVTTADRRDTLRAIAPIPELNHRRLTGSGREFHSFMFSVRGSLMFEKQSTSRLTLRLFITM